MSVRLNSAIALAFCLSACSGDSPVHTTLQQSPAEATIGPSGGVLRGDATLAGFVLDIPVGALRQLVRIRVEPGPDLAEPGTSAASPAVRITTDPDPGGLLKAATLVLRIDLPRLRRAGDLVVVGRQRVPAVPGLSPMERPSLLAATGSYDKDTELFTANVQSLSDMQVRLTDTSRQSLDATALADLAVKELNQLTNAGLAQADLLLAGALRADPFDPRARLLRAVTRVLVVLNDRTDDGAGLDSVGEALNAVGLDLRSMSLLERAVAGVWPRVPPQPPGGPAASDVLAVFTSRLRPALLLALEDLAYVPAASDLTVTLPQLLTSVAGAREVDAADICFLRATLALTVFTLDFLADLDLDSVDLEDLTSALGQVRSAQAKLARNEKFGRLRTQPGDPTLAAAAEGMSALAQGFTLLAGETDPQQNDLLVLGAAFGAARQGRWHDNLQNLLASLLQPGPRTVTLEQHGALQVDLLAPLASGGLDPRRLMPAFYKFLPLAGSLQDPALGGLLPGLSQDNATGLFGLSSKHDLTQVNVVIDGDVSDWPKASEALLPQDAAGEITVLDALDLRSVYLGRTGDDVVFRLTLHEGSFRWRQNRAQAYGILIDDLRDHPGGHTTRIRVTMAQAGPTVEVRRRGKVVAVRSNVALAGRDLEFAVHRADLFDPDDPVRDRIVRAFSIGLDTVRGIGERDVTRRIATQL